MKTEMMMELYGMITKEYLNSVAASFQNLSKSKNSRPILCYGFNLITNIFKYMTVNGAELDTIYMTCKDVIFMYLEYMDQAILVHEYSAEDIINANIFIYNKLKTTIFANTIQPTFINPGSLSIMERLTHCIVDWKNKGFRVEDRIRNCDTFLSSYLTEFAAMELDIKESALSILEYVREKYEPMDQVKFSIYLAEFLHAIKGRKKIDSFELYSKIYGEESKQFYLAFLKSGEKKEIRRFFSNLL